MTEQQQAENLSLQDGPMQAKVDDLGERRVEAQTMGGPARIERQRKAGKLTARERVDLLIDEGTFREYGMLASHSAHRAETEGLVTPADGVVTGFGEIDGRKAGVVAEDFTVRGGSIGMTGMAKKLRMVEISTRERVPLVWMLDGAGARAEEFIAEGMPPIAHHLKIAQMSGIAPQVGLVMGPSA
ncbi:MAG: carboxyl transferase domain-containing protein, partial [Actinomycetota bacterium]|nr:carboxyl transferase domain-containing protein [Actinomycetota bacterium]